MRIANGNEYMDKSDILRVAMQCFSTKGYAATNMSDIANILGISRTPLYYHYKNKKVLFEECVSMYLQRLISTIRECLGKEGRFFDNQWEELLYLTSEESFMSYRLFDEIRKLREECPDAYRTYVESMDQVLDLKKQAISRAVKEGEIRADISLDEIAMAFFGISVLLNSTGYRHFLKRKNVSIEHALEIQVSLMRTRFQANLDL